MWHSAEEKILSKIIAFGSAFTTIFIISGSVTDPVNVTKFVALGVTSFAAMGIVFSGSLRFHLRGSLLVWAALAIFLASAIGSTIMSDSPLSQNLYGVFGRNNGLITYIFLAILLLATLSLRSKESFTRIVKSLIFAGLINVIYCLWVISFGDFIGWNNPYGNILGTLGNPNFIGSFLGIFLAAYVGYGLETSSPKWFKYSVLIVAPLTTFEIFESHAIQGRVVGLAGLGVVGFFYVRSKSNQLLTWTYILSGAVGGIFALLGAFQIGPLTSYIYKTSVSLRGQYWLAGWNTGEANPIFGAGMDAFGNWYRRSRDIRALELPGVNTVVDASHNVPIDMFAFGGWPLFLAYIFLMSLGAWAIIRTSLRVTKFDSVLAVLAATWIGYQLQSIISINQIGLAIWGWVLTGAVIAYERATRENSNSPISEKTSSRPRVHNKGQDAKPTLYASTFALTGLLIALPPLTADAKWRSAQLARTVEGLQATMKPGYFNPQNASKYLTNVQTLEQSQLFELAHTYAVEAVKWNPESFELWKLLYLVKDATQKEREQALNNMKRLDPLNPDVTALE
jgi:hypothetical protein